MNSIGDILTAAARLTAAELRALKVGIDTLERQARAIKLTVGGQAFRLIPLDDYEFYDLSRQSIAIEEDLWFQIQFHLARRTHGDDLSFAELYAALRAVAGESRRSFDDWKGAFSFPFTLSFNRAGKELTYLLEVHVSRDSLYFPLRKVVAKDDERLKDRAYHKPIPEELSQDEINRFLVHFYGFLRGRLEALDRASIAPFVRSVPASRIVFGFHTGAFFEEQYKSEEEYHAALTQHRQQLERVSASNVLPNVIV